jgi:hypothetical protein
MPNKYGSARKASLRQSVYNRPCRIQLATAVVSWLLRTAHKVCCSRGHIIAQRHTCTRGGLTSHCQCGPLEDLCTAQLGITRATNTSAASTCEYRNQRRQKVTKTRRWNSVAALRECAAHCACHKAPHTNKPKAGWRLVISQHYVNCRRSAGLF